MNTNEQIKLHPTPNNKHQTTNNMSRPSPQWRLNLAQAYAAKGELDKAEPLVKQAYAEDPSVKDGYAKIGWQKYWPEKEYDKVIEYCEKDLVHGWTRIHTDEDGIGHEKHENNKQQTTNNIPYSEKYLIHGWTRIHTEKDKDDHEKSTEGTKKEVSSPLCGQP